jgi:hypothetical protein
LLELISEDGELKIDPEDEIVKGALVTSAGPPAPRSDDEPPTSGLR